jgi:hypothetical protein
VVLITCDRSMAAFIVGDLGRLNAVAAIRGESALRRAIRQAMAAALEALAAS